MTSIKKNYFYNLSYQILSILIPFITTPYVSRVLGADGVGAYAYTYGIVSYFAIFAATGTVNYGNREIAKNQDNKYERSKIFWEVFLFRLICTFVVTIAYCIFIFIIFKEYRILFVIHFLTVASWIFDISWFFQGMENFRVTALRNGIIKIIGTLLIFAFVKNDNDVWIYTLIFCFATLFGNLSMWTFLKKDICYIPIRQLNLLRCIRPVMGLFAPVIAIQIYVVLNKTMLGSMKGVAEVGYYTQAERIVQMILTIIASVVGVLMPRIAHLYKNGDLTKVSLYYHKAIDYIFLLALPVIFGLAAVADIFVPIFFGPGYDSVAILLHILSALFIILSLGQLFGVFLVAMDKQRQYTIAVSVAALTNFFLNIILIIPFGSIGASVATVIAEFVSTFIQAYYIRNILDMRYLFRSFAHYFVPAFLMFACVFCIRFVDIGILTELILSICVGGLVYGGYLLLMKDDFLFSVLKIPQHKGKHVQ
ncbi:flippase [Bifidobacterium avesanii]|uniref:Oligosaccharide flippase family protein n=1 Tax=Bifidobacterium avesanii TaxID=1798157 RepID=A0A7K3TJA8_9BIFI|nr:flippase [Bifidobacterium avesanii]KAB8287931.1 transporter [Bifidobacterium avesanii]NEG79207.1 oligosaccharide flippase family protein [Bifidobacterium avesanii]